MDKHGSLRKFERKLHLISSPLFTAGLLFFLPRGGIMKSGLGPEKFHLHAGHSENGRRRHLCLIYPPPPPPPPRPPLKGENLGSQVRRSGWEGGGQKAAGGWFVPPPPLPQRHKSNARLNFPFSLSPPLAFTRWSETDEEEEEEGAKKEKEEGGRRRRSHICQRNSIYGERGIVDYYTVVEGSFFPLWQGKLDSTA